MKVGRFTLTFRYPKKVEVLLLEADKSPHLTRCCDGLTTDVHISANRLVVLRPRFLWFAWKFFRQTTRIASLLAARLQSQRIPMLLSMENYNKFNKNGDSSKTLLDDVSSVVPNVKLYLVQHGQELRRLPYRSPMKNSTLFCWGDWTRANFPSFGRNEETFLTVGPLIDGLYRTIRPVPIEVQNDICLVSTVKDESWWGAHKTERSAAFETLVEFVARYSSIHRVGVTVALTIDRDQNPEEDESAIEKMWFEKRLGSMVKFSEPSLLFGKSDKGHQGRVTPTYVKERYSTYYLCDSSRVTIGAASSVLWESFGRGNRLLSVNCSRNSNFDFPIPGVWSLANPTYSEFEERLHLILRYTDEEWIVESRDSMCNLVYFDPENPPHQMINGVLRQNLANP